MKRKWSLVAAMGYGAIFGGPTNWNLSGLRSVSVAEPLPRKIIS